MISTGIHKHTGNVYNLSVVDNHYKQKSKKNDFRHNNYNCISDQSDTGLVMYLTNHKAAY